MEKEIEVPTYIQDRIDVKGQAIIAFATAVKACSEEENSMLDPNTKVILLTTIGQVSGKFSTFLDKPEDITNNTVQKVNNYLLMLKNVGLTAIEKGMNGNSTIVNNSGVVIVTDAILKPYSNPQCCHKYKILNLFADQIVGFSFENGFVKYFV